jgi:hypothetical protein
VEQHRVHQRRREVNGRCALRLFSAGELVRRGRGCGRRDRGNEWEGEGERRSVGASWCRFRAAVYAMERLESKRKDGREGTRKGRTAEEVRKRTAKRESLWLSWKPV